MQEHTATIFNIFPTVEPHVDPLVEKITKNLALLTQIKLGRL